MEAGSCRCGHAGAAHEHYRRGTDCALCDCPRYASERRAAGRVGAVLRHLVRRSPR